jgi:hypothetical protein
MSIRVDGKVGWKVCSFLFCMVAFITFALKTEGSKAEDKPPWKSLFDGKTLNGWIPRGGKAPYTIEDGAIVGTSKEGEPNSFLCTENNFGDFILEFEFKGDPELNSGVQFRSNSIPEYRDGRVHGYQIELTGEKGERDTTGGIYDEARRGWLYRREDKSYITKVSERDGWISVRLEAIGDHIKTWVNGVPTAYLVDDQTQEGFIGLQVHKVGEGSTTKSVRWRNIRIVTDNPSKYVTPTPLSPKSMINKLTPNELKQGWKLLFDGQSSKGWRGSRIDTFPQQGWVIKDGMLTVLESNKKESGNGGDIVTLEKFSKFDLCVDFRITSGSNSGIKYYVDTDGKKDKPVIGLEYQILDAQLHRDANKGTNPGIRTLSALYDLISPNENKKARPVGAWNHARIISDGKLIQHWLNGRKVLEYNRDHDDFRKLVAGSKFKGNVGFGQAESGAILLQDHGHEVSFRSIRIRP